jgi:hypothetical protein
MQLQKCRCRLGSPSFGLGRLGRRGNPSSKPTISPSQRSPKYCIAISAGCPGPMSPVNWAIVNSTASARCVASRPAESRAWAISGERVASAIATSLDRGAGLLGDLEPNRPACLLLNDGGPFDIGNG